jgi:hypothetical protein
LGSRGKQIWQVS